MFANLIGIFLDTRRYQSKNIFNVLTSVERALPQSSGLACFPCCCCFFLGGEEISLMLFQYVVLEFQSEHIVVLIRVGCDSRTAWKWQLKTTPGWKMPHNSNQLHGKKTWGKIRKLQEYPQVESSANPKNSSVRGGRCHLLFSYGRHDSSQTGRLGP